ncbi:hypothetical protein [Moorena sp. SIO1G6]|nr:hypothetical protein [Moorena sp. SIO1G6]
MLKINFIWDNLIVSIQRSAVSGQPSADLTQIKRMLTCFIQKHLK